MKSMREDRSCISVQSEFVETELLAKDNLGWLSFGFLKVQKEYDETCVA
jgi:hypothetical protein